MSHVAFRSLSLLLSILAATAAGQGRAAAECLPGDSIAPGDHSFDMEFDGIAHDYIVHVPPGYDGSRPVPLVVDLHGFSSNGRQQLGASGFPGVADENGFLVVAPTGYRNSWNGDIAFGTAYEQKLDDVGFLRALVAHIGEIANIDRGRVYATGLSNGAAMSNKLGCEATDTFAAVAPVADPLDISLDTCHPQQPTAVLGFHGYSDPYVPYEGGPGSGPPLPEPFPSIAQTLQNWAGIMECTGTAETDSLGGRNKCEVYRECKGGVQVGYCSIEGGHVLYQQTVLDIADYAWEFFQSFALPLPDADGDGINDADDNCPAFANSDQADANGNCVGDACECAADADCDDGEFCNGSELCQDGACQAGSTPCPAGEQCDEDADRCGTAATKADAGASGGAAGTDAEGGTAVQGSASAGQPPAAAGSGAPTAGDPAASGAASPEVAGDANGAMSPADTAADGGCGCRIAGGARSRSAAGFGALWIGALLAYRRRRYPC